MNYLLLFLLISYASPLYPLLSLLRSWSAWNHTNRQELLRALTEPTPPASLNDEPRASSFNELAPGTINTDILEIAEFIRNSDELQAIGAHRPRGILLFGPPGTGKTSIARALAGETSAAFFAASGSQFVEMYVGVGPARVRELFDNARKALKNGSPAAIIFIDEIDAIGGKRGAEGNSEYRNTLNELLTQLDGFNRTDKIFVLAATNNPRLLDPALTRPGRFDRMVKVDLPDEAARQAIIAFYLAKTQHGVSPEMLRLVAQQTAGYSAAELENIINEAAILAVREREKVITDKHLLAAHKKIAQGKQAVS